MIASTLSLIAIAAGAAAAPVSLIQTAVEAVETNVTHQAAAEWYMQNGNYGACGVLSSDSDLVAGLPLEFYSDLGAVSPYCGNYIVVQNNQNNVTKTIRVEDASATNSTLSLSVASWRALDGDSSNLSSSSLASFACGSKELTFALQRLSPGASPTRLKPLPLLNLLLRLRPTVARPRGRPCPTTPLHRRRLRRPPLLLPPRRLRRPLPRRRRLRPSLPRRRRPPPSLRRPGRLRLRASLPSKLRLHNNRTARARPAATRTLAKLPGTLKAVKLARAVLSTLIHPTSSPSRAPS